MWRCHNRERLLSSPEDKLEYLRTVRDDYMSKCKDDFVLHCYNVMSNHVHEEGKSGDSHKPISDHMRRSHSRFAQGFNRRNGRMGSVVNDRPKTQPVENNDYLIRLQLYIDFNPVKAGITKKPDDIRFRKFSSCRFYAHGERTEFTVMLTPPDWYLALGPTPEARQHEYRSMLDRYMVEMRLKADPTDCKGLYIGSDEYKAHMRRRSREWRRSHSARGVEVEAYDDSS